MADERERRLNILHVMRAPVGGLFRHVVDLARGQTARGHRVGLIADPSTGGAQAEATLSALASELALGVTPRADEPRSRRRAICRRPARRAARRRRRRRCHAWPWRQGRRLRAARLIASRTAREDDPRLHAHGGSLHYRWGSPDGLCLSRRRTCAHEPHRSVPVRERLRPRRVHAPRSASRKRARAGRAQWCHRRTNSSRSW